MDITDRKHIYPSAPFEPSKAELAAIQKRYNPKAKPELDDDDDDDDDIFSVKPDAKVEKSDLDLLADLDVGDAFEPSVKMIKMMELIKQWDEEAPEDKIVVYSQFTGYIDS